MKMLRHVTLTSSHTWPTFLVLLLAGVGAPSAHAQAVVSETEQRLLAEVEARAEEAIALLERSVNINSGTMNFEGVREVGLLFREELDALGFETEWVDGAPFDRAGHLVA